MTRIRRKRTALTPDEVEAIRTLAKAGLTSRAIARRIVGRDQSTVERLIADVEIGATERARRRVEAAHLGARGQREMRAHCPTSITAMAFSPEWWLQNDVNFRRGVRLAAEREALDASEALTSIRRITSDRRKRRDGGRTK